MNSTDWLVDYCVRTNKVSALRWRGQIWYNLGMVSVATRLWLLANKLDHVVKMATQPEVKV